MNRSMVVVEVNVGVGTRALRAAGCVAQLAAAHSQLMQYATALAEKGAEDEVSCEPRAVAICGFVNDAVLASHMACVSFSCSALWPSYFSFFFCVAEDSEHRICVTKRCTLVRLVVVTSNVSSRDGLLVLFSRCEVAPADADKGSSGLDVAVYSVVTRDDETLLTLTKGKSDVSG